jgi:hypothetical protein
MERTGDETGWSDRDTAREFVYAVPAALVIFVHALVALVALGGVIMGVDRLESTSTSLYRLLIPLAALVVGVAATALSAALWSRSSWWIVAVPACTLPGLVVAGFAYMAISWGY